MQAQVRQLRCGLDQHGLLRCNRPAAAAEGNGAQLTQQGLTQLTGLQQLHVYRSEQVTDEVVDRFWAVVRRQ